MTVARSGESVVEGGQVGTVLSVVLGRAFWERRERAFGGLRRRQPQRLRAFLQRAAERLAAATQRLTVAVCAVCDVRDWQGSFI